MMLRSLVFHAAWTGWTLLLGLSSPLFLPSRRASLWLARQWNAGTVWLAKHVLGISVRFEGAPQPGPAIYAAKHQSALETFALWLALGNPAFVLKRELLQIPIFGWFLARTGPIAINRAEGQSAVEQIRAQAAPILGQGRSIVIFPEGTRRLPGASPRYKSGGVWALYQLGMPLVPVALNTGSFWPKKGRKRAGIATIALLEPMPAGQTKEAMMQQLQQTLERESTMLRN